MCADAQQIFKLHVVITDKSEAGLFILNKMFYPGALICFYKEILFYLF